MLLAIDPHSGVPIYRQLLDQLRRQIAAEVLEPGAELPSTRNLAAQLGINPMTVSKVFSLLENEGLVERRPGLPLTVRARAAEEVQRTKEDQLRTALEGPVQLSRQLQLSSRQALEIFEQLLRELKGKEKK